MEIDEFRNFCLALPEVEESMPFGPNTLVFKVHQKMFALTDLNTFDSINLKCDPDQAIELRDQFHGVRPGYHMNKKHWNTVAMREDIPPRLLKQWVLDSYHLVIQKMSRKDQERIKQKLEG